MRAIHSHAYAQHLAEFRAQRHTLLQAGSAPLRARAIAAASTGSAHNILLQSTAMSVQVMQIRAGAMCTGQAVLGTLSAAGRRRAAKDAEPPAARVAKAPLTCLVDRESLSRLTRCRCCVDCAVWE